MGRDIKEDQTSSGHISANVSGQIQGLTEQASPADADVVLGESSVGGTWSKIRIPKVNLGSVGTGQIMLLSRDDWGYHELSTSPVEKFTFEFIRHSIQPMLSLLLIAEIWCPDTYGGGTSVVTLNVSEIVENTASTTSPTAVIETTSVDVSGISVDTVLNCSIRLHKVGGSGDYANLKLIEVYGVY